MEQYNNVDIGLNIGTGIEIKTQGKAKAFIEAEFYLGVTDIAAGEFADAIDAAARNRTFCIGTGVRF